MDSLLEAALLARTRAVAPYSRFLVGAALQSADGAIYAGCNIESASYGLTMCAERVAVYHATAQGVRAFTRIAVAADTDTLTPPCGACRQILWEFCGDCEVVLVNLHGRTETFRMRDLLPRAFDASFL